MLFLSPRTGIAACSPPEAALCHDEDIVQSFDEGILWITLGQQPNLMANLLTAYAALTGDRPGFATEEDAVHKRVAGSGVAVVGDYVEEWLTLGIALRFAARLSRWLRPRLPT